MKTNMENHIGIQIAPARKRIVRSLVLLLLLASILLSAVGCAFTGGPTVYSYDGAQLREDAYAYWYACLKYDYLVYYKALEIEDTPEGWAALGADGRSYAEAFDEVIREEILLRFIAASVFDSEGYALSDSSYSAIHSILDEMKTERFGDVPFDVLEEKYGVGERAVKQEMLYEKKYAELYARLFSDPSAVYGDEHSIALRSFYEKHYSRYNMIYVEDSVGSVHIDALEAKLWPDGNVGEAAVTGVSEEDFKSLERNYTMGTGVTSGNYPGGIYLYDGESYTNTFSAELLSAFEAADEVGKIVKVRSAENDASYYVMRYALDSEPYLSENKEIAACFSKLPSYAGAYLYRQLLKDELEHVKSHDIAEGYTVTNVTACEDFCNAVRLLGN